MGVIAKIEAWLQGKKTYILVIGAIVAAIVGYVEGTFTLIQAGQAIWIALFGGALRSGVTKSTGPTP